MRRSGSAFGIFVLLATAAAAQPASDGARPGNIIGTGMSLPRSDAASNLDAATTHSDLATNLPAPAAADDVRSLLMAARRALSAGRTGEAQDALERAETRALDRSVVVGTQNEPAGGPVIAGIGRARSALAAGNMAAAIQSIDRTLPVLGDR
jgi:hypothetical protein